MSLSNLPKVHPWTFGNMQTDQPVTKHNKEYEISPSAPSKLPLVASSRRQLLIFLERYAQG